MGVLDAAGPAGGVKRLTAAPGDAAPGVVVKKQRGEPQQQVVDLC